MKNIFIILSIFFASVSNGQLYRFIYSTGTDSTYMKMGTDSTFSKSGDSYVFKNRLPVKAKTWLGYIAAMQSLLDLKANAAHTHSANQITGLVDAYSKTETDARYQLSSVGAMAATEITINGTSQNLSTSRTWTIPIKPSFSAPVIGLSITMGTAFQPKADGPCHIVINAALTGALGLLENITVQMCATQNGTYVTVATDQLLIGVVGQPIGRSVAGIPVPGGYWMKVLRSGSAATANYTRWDY